MKLSILIIVTLILCGCEGAYKHEKVDSIYDWANKKHGEYYNKAQQFIIDNKMDSATLYLGGMVAFSEMCDYLNQLKK